MAFLIAVASPVKLQHDACKITAALPVQHIFRHVNSRIRGVFRRAEAELREASAYYPAQERRSEAGVCSDAEVRRIAHCRMRLYKLIGIAVHIEKQHPRVLVAHLAEPPVMLIVIPACSELCLRVCVLDRFPVIGFFIAEAHAAALHYFLRADKALDITEQTAYLKALRAAEIFFRYHASCADIPHFVVVVHELIM